MNSKHVPYLLLLVVGCFSIASWLSADDPKVSETAAAAKAAKKAAEETSAKAAAAVEAAAKAVIKAVEAEAEAAKAKKKAADDAAKAKKANEPAERVKKASASIKKAVEKHAAIDQALNSAWLAAKALSASKLAKNKALDAAAKAAALSNASTDKTAQEKENLAKDLTTKQQEYVAARNALEIAEGAYQQSMSELKKALQSVESLHKAAIDQASKMEELLETVAGEKSDAKKVTQAPKTTTPSTGVEPPNPPPTVAEKSEPSSPAHRHPPATTNPIASTPLPPNPRVRAMSPTSTQHQHVDAFQKLPRLKPVTTDQDSSDFNDKVTDTADGKVVADEFVCDYRFDQPAHFPLPAFGLGGEMIQDAGLIIYEGMRLAVMSDGRYQLRFVAGTPAVPVDMKLQFVLEDQDTFERYTLTLPRVAIPRQDKPKYSSQRREIEPVYRDVQIVHHEGFLPVLAQKPKAIRVVRRAGTARFGFGVDVP